MARITEPQEIPAWLLDHYRATLTEEGFLHRVQGRYPYRVPTMQTLRGRPTKAQLAQRAVFLKCVKCYNIQPYSGGATPPAQGPRNRSWWFTDAISSGLWYFDYFMQQTINQYLSIPKVDWCFVQVGKDTLVDEWTPDDNFGGLNAIATAVGEADKRAHILISKEADLTRTLNIWLWTRYSDPFGEDEAEVALYLTGAWNENTVTWNTKPEVGPLVVSKIIGYPQASWKSITIPKEFMNETSFYLKIIGRGGIPLGTFFELKFVSSENAWTERRPYWT